MATVSGTVKDTNTTGVARLIRVYRRDTGAMLGETASSVIDGTWSFTDAHTGEVQVVMLDDALGTLENDQILRTTPV